MTAGASEKVQALIDAVRAEMDYNDQLATGLRFANQRLGNILVQLNEIHGVDTSAAE